MINIPYCLPSSLLQINMKGLDGIQGPVYVGTGCVFKRQALYGYEPPKGSKRPKMMSCGCCPCFGRRRKNKKFSKNDMNGDVAALGGKLSQQPYNIGPYEVDLVYLESYRSDNVFWQEQKVIRSI